MHWYFSVLLFGNLLLFVQPFNHNVEKNDSATAYKVVQQIALPAGFKRMNAEKHSFAEWLRNIQLKKDKTVYLYNGLPKRNQAAQYAVLDIPVGNKDLQQCADAVMRLRASYLFDKGRMNEIIFYDNNRKAYPYLGGPDIKRFELYLDKVFAYCGTASLEKQLKRKNMNDISPGDVFIKGGFPGHAVMVMDMAINNTGEKAFMLAQSYMPAQDIHILNNPQFSIISPWYTIPANQLITPEWIFQSTQLYGW